MKKIKSDKRKKIGIACAVLAAVLAVAVWMAVLLSRGSELKSELTEKENVSAQWEEENAALQALIDGENESELMEEYARKNGYVYADERVYIKGS